MATNKLTDPAVRNAKPGDAPRKLTDGGGMFLSIQPSGSKWWRLAYRFDGKQKLLALGTYPDTSLADARLKRDEARKLLANGIDPSAHKKAVKRAETALVKNTFEAVAREWFAKYAPSWAPTHADKILRRLERDVFPWLGHRPAGAIEAPEILDVLRRVEARGALETAHRVQQNIGQAMRYAIATGRATRNPAADLKGALPPATPRHHPSVTDPKAVGALLRALESYSGTLPVRCALRLAPLVFVRPGELRQADWAEFNFDAAEWRIPKDRMKARAPHVVPLPHQAIAILQELRPLTGSGRYVFPSTRSAQRPMSENTVNGALRRLGYSKDEMTGHGFRSIASTTLNEQGWHPDAIERQLAHAERNAIRGAYNYAEHLPERRRMMQAWADYLDKLRAGADVIRLHQSV